MNIYDFIEKMGWPRGLVQRQNSKLPGHGGFCPPFTLGLGWGLPEQHYKHGQWYSGLL